MSRKTRTDQVKTGIQGNATADPFAYERPMARPEVVPRAAAIVDASSSESKASAEASAPTWRVHLIRIADREAMNRAVMTLGDVRVAYCGFPDSRLLVANEHIDALRREGIPFDQLS